MTALDNRPSDSACWEAMNTALRVIAECETQALCEAAVQACVLACPPRNTATRTALHQAAEAIRQAIDPGARLTAQQHVWAAMVAMPTGFPPAVLPPILGNLRHCGQRLPQAARYCPGCGLSVAEGCVG